MSEPLTPELLEEAFSAMVNQKPVELPENCSSCNKKLTRYEEVFLWDHCRKCVKKIADDL